MYLHPCSILPRTYGVLLQVSLCTLRPRQMSWRSHINWPKTSIVLFESACVCHVQRHNLKALFFGVAMLSGSLVIRPHSFITKHLSVRRHTGFKPVVSLTKCDGSICTYFPVQTRFVQIKASFSGGVVNIAVCHG